MRYAYCTLASSKWSLMRNFVLAFFILIPSLGCCELMPFVTIKNDGYYDSSSFTWDANENHYSLNADAVLVLTSNKLSNSRQIKLPIGTFVVQMSLLNYSGDILMALETDFAGDGQGYICRVKNNLSKVYWCRKTGTFNIHASASADSILIGGIKTISRLNPKSGNYIWNHTSASDYFSNCPVLENDTTVTFISQDTDRVGSVAKQRIIDRNSGEIIKIADIGTIKDCK
jgi:hypothetical protein